MYGIYAHVVAIAGWQAYVSYFFKPQCLISHVALCLFTLVGSALYAQPSGEVDRWRHDYDDLLQGAGVSIHVVDIQSGATVWGYNEHLLLTPASIMKLLPVGYLLRQAAPDKVFQTTLGPAPSAYIRHDTLFGDLHLTGYGDPTLGTKMVDGALSADACKAAWVNAVKSRGIHVITGNIVGIDAAYDQMIIPGGYALEDAGNYYAAPASGLSFGKNSYTLQLTSGAPGSRVTIGETNPKIPGLIHRSVVFAQGTRDQAYIYGMPMQYNRWVVGTIPPYQPSFTIQGAVPDPPLLAASVLHTALQKAGIQVGGKAATADYSEEKHPKWWVGQSPPLSLLLQYTLHESDNRLAEGWVKELARNSNGNGSLQSGLALLRDSLSRLSLPVAHFSVVDGSGLSRGNALSASHFTYFLRDQFYTSHGRTFINLLAGAGEEGTMQLVDLPEDFGGHLVGKSGYMTGVRSYAGYYRSPAGRWYAYAFVANNYNGSAGDMRRAFAKLMASFTTLP